MSQYSGYGNPYYGGYYYPYDNQTPYYGYDQPKYVTGHAEGSGSSFHKIEDFQPPHEYPRIYPDYQSPYDINPSRSTPQSSYMQDHAISDDNHRNFLVPENEYQVPTTTFLSGSYSIKGKERQSQDFGQSPHSGIQSLKGKERQYQDFEESLDEPDPADEMSELGVVGILRIVEFLKHNMKFHTVKFISEREKQQQQQWLEINPSTRSTTKQLNQIVVRTGAYGSTPAAGTDFPMSWDRSKYEAGNFEGTEGRNSLTQGGGSWIELSSKYWLMGGINVVIEVLVNPGGAWLYGQWQGYGRSLPGQLEDGLWEMFDGLWSLWDKIEALYRAE
ncbi:hypothetical protein BY996DRAFT_6500205 [Phakopsora pachyrhizi]|nr:hypothetical protein BY996DRAFT_6500205 [Phakopsora pachyrhizi]